VYRPDLSPQRVLDALPRSRDQKETKARLARKLNVQEYQITRLGEFLDHFVTAGLASVKNGGYWRKTLAGVLIGTLRGTRSGYAFVVPEDEGERRAGDLYVDQRRLASALHGDKVIARVIAAGRRGREGRVEAVLVPANLTVVGRFARVGKAAVVTPVEDRLPYEISIAPSGTLEARDADYVNVEVTRLPIAGRQPWGRVIEVLGPIETPGVDIEIILRRHRLPFVFPESVLAEAAAVPDSVTDAQLAGRIDLREVIAITIDGETARDFDDAVSLEPLPNERLRLGVHIADVSHYVRAGSALDEEALRRGTSIYFPERAIPMLPERLSNGICSLNPRVDRLTMSVLLEIDRGGRVFDYLLTPSVITSRERMTYMSVNEMIVNPDGEAAREHSHLRELVSRMHNLARSLIKRREERGAIDFDLPEAELLFNDEGQIGGVARSERNIAHRIIEEFMLLANETVSRHLEGLGVPTLFRIHEEPNMEKVEEFAEIAASFGYTFSMHGPVPQRGFQKLAREAVGRPEERMLSYLMLRSMQRARYSAQNRGHFGLAMTSYTHFTSPIRRYPDLIVHRILREVLETDRVGEGRNRIERGSKRALRRLDRPVLGEERESEWRSIVEPVAEQSSERERAADAAERELMNWRKAEFMVSRVGEVFEGVIASVKEYGFYVELNDVFIEGLVHVSTLEGEYEFRERKHRLVNRRSGSEFRLGDAVTVRVDRVDRVRQLIDFSVAEKQ
jgi:ribonuclease R